MESSENNTKSIQISNSQSQVVLTETKGQITNKNIEDLKKLQKTKAMFDKIYSILNRISTENDFDAIYFAVKNKFCDVKNQYNETIYDHSIILGNFQLVRLIIEFSGKSKYNFKFDIDKSYFLVKLLFPISALDIHSTLIWASCFGHYEVVKFLLTVPGIDINAKDDENRWTALIWASAESHYDVVKLLLTVPGIDVNAKDDENTTALIWASEKGRHEVVKLLLTVPGIDVNARDSNNRTALICASRFGHHDVVKLLLTVPEIDVNAKDEDDNTALMHASSNGYHDVVNLLLTVPGIDANVIPLPVSRFYGAFGHPK